MEDTWPARVVRKESEKAYGNRETPLSNSRISRSPHSRAVRKRVCVVPYFPFPSVSKHLPQANGAHSRQALAAQAEAALEMAQQAPDCPHSLARTPFHQGPLKDKGRETPPRL